MALKIKYLLASFYDAECLKFFIL